MDDSQWCLDECPTCATAMQGKSLYCSAECEPNSGQELDPQPNYVQSRESSTARVSAWALDCYKSSITPASSPGIFPSPSRRKLHLRKQYPTSWVTPDAPSHPTSSYVSSPMSSSTAVESLVASSTAAASPNSRHPARSWASPSPAPPTHPLLTKTNIYLFAESPAGRLPSSFQTSERPPSELWTPKVAAPDRPRCLASKQRRQDERIKHGPQDSP
ncbi:hypothetical protein B0H17DRAFT_638868 [Mycena rosella]|uniref:Uncharacterized protein n=1 Tax=Mycena rosella TaxID=1033263 RepID=A0AAD7DEM8_MYCRO|nr:hypothetical protein B0H17DRAFT_638868 [Mycena rosella]